MPLPKYLLLTFALLITSTGSLQAQESVAPVTEPVANGRLIPAEVHLWHGIHPRLLFSRGDLARLQERRAVHTEAYNLLLKRADGDMAIAPGDIGKHRPRLPAALPRLALAGLLSGDRRYTTKAVSLLMAQLDDSAALSDVYMAQLMTALALTYDWTHEAMTPQERRDAARRMAAITNQFHQFMTRRDSSLGQLLHLPNVAGHHRLAQAAGGLGLMVLVLRGEANLDLITSGTATCDAAARGYLLNAFGADGAGIEGFDMTMEALGGLLPYVLARRQMDKFDLAEGSALSMVPAWAVYELTSGPAMMPLGESGRNPLTAAAALALLAPVAADAALHRWFVDQILTKEAWESLAEASAEDTSDIWHMLYANRQTLPRPPQASLPLVKFFPSRGIGYARSGWLTDKGETIISFQAAAQPHLGKWQLDVNQFTYRAFGIGWAIDSGPGRQELGGREVLTLRAHSEGHNLMEIDAAGQARPFGRMIAFHDESDWLIAIGDGTESYGIRTFRRAIIVGKRDGLVRYLIIADEVDPGDDAQHTYRHFLHTSAGNTVEIRGHAATITAPGGAVAQYVVIAPQANGLELKVADFPPRSSALHPRIEARHARRGPFMMISVLVADAAPPKAPAPSPAPSPETPASPVSPPAANGGEAAAGARPAAGAAAVAKPRAIINVDHVGPAVAFRVTVDGIEDRICILTRPDARPPFGYGSATHRLQLKSGQAAKTLLFDYSEPGHDSPATPSTHSARDE